MNQIDWDALRDKIRSSFLKWYAQKPKRYGEPDTFDKSFKTSNLDTFEELADSFKAVTGERPGTSTFRKLFYEKKTNFHGKNVRLFFDYVDNIEGLDQTDADLAVLHKAHSKWIKSLDDPILSHQYFMPLSDYTQIFKTAYSKMELLQQSYLRYLMVVAVYYGDTSFHLYIDRCKNDKEMVQILFRLVLFTWIRVSWRSAYVLTQLNDFLVSDRINTLQCDSLTKQEFMLLERIKAKDIEAYLEEIINDDLSVESKIYANQVLRQIRSKPYK